MYLPTIGFVRRSAECRTEKMEEKVWKRKSACPEGASAPIVRSLGYSMTANRDHIPGRTHQCIILIRIDQPYMCAKPCMCNFFISQIDVPEESLGIP